MNKDGELGAMVDLLNGWFLLKLWVPWYAGYTIGKVDRTNPACRKYKGGLNQHGCFLVGPAFLADIAHSPTGRTSGSAEKIYIYIYIGRAAS